MSRMKTARSFFATILVVLSVNVFAAEQTAPADASRDSVQAVGGAASPSGTYRPTTQEAMFQRPFLSSLTSSTSIGGYAEANAHMQRNDGISEGLSMEMRRWNLFVYSSISTRLKMMAEVELEHGSEEISLETAQIDYVFHSAAVLRAGIMLAPIGSFNQRHDSPLYEFVERPLVATHIIPSTLSLVGFGFNGKFFPSDKLVFTYDVDVCNGLHDGIVLNKLGRTALQAGKSNELFEESSNGVPAVISRVAMRHRDYGEIGLSTYQGVYNSFSDEGVAIAPKQHLTLYAVDYVLDLPSIQVRGESALMSLDVPSNLQTTYAAKQWGSYLEAVVPVVRFKFLDDESAQLLASVRFDYIDLNDGSFSDGSKIYDDEKDVCAAISFRPTTSTCFRLNLRRAWIQDPIGNPTNSSTLSFGVATYF